MRIIASKAPSAATAPYSPAVVSMGLLFTSGQLPCDTETGEIIGADITEQAEQVMRNLAAILREAGTDFSKVVKTTCYITNMEDFAGFGAVYAKYFTQKPARSCVTVKWLPKNVLCEVELIAEV
ncbi:MAG: Rid family detoxifying hydrolase [Clostridiales bacterium]|jgi:2-iminobutanoate/2-iminopropanoate deaminase|nr:Rid family detoxifying hydrolase [Clostridiales bacterium]